MRFDCPLQIVHVAWDNIWPGEAMPRLDSYDFEVKVLGATPRTLYPGETKEECDASVAYPSGQPLSTPRLKVSPGDLPWGCFAPRSFVHVKPRAEAGLDLVTGPITPFWVELWLGKVQRAHLKALPQGAEETEGR